MKKVADHSLTSSVSCQLILPQSGEPLTVPDGEAMVAEERGSNAIKRSSLARSCQGHEGAFWTHTANKAIDRKSNPASSPRRP